MIPEILWWLHSSKKEGLIPRVHSFDETHIDSSVSIGFTPYTHDDDEFDFLLTQCVAQGFDSAYGTTWARRLEINIGLASTNITIGAMGGTLTNAHNLTTVNIPSPFIIRSGNTINVAAWFTASAVTNTIMCGGYGFLIPRLDI